MNIFDFFTPKSETYYMHTKSTVRQAIEKFDHHKLGVVPLIDENGAYVSTISEGDILRYIKNAAGFDIAIAENTLLDEVDRYRPYKAYNISVSMDEVIKIAFDQNFVPIVDDRGYYMGIVKRKTLLELLYEKSSGRLA